VVRELNGSAVQSCLEKSRRRRHEFGRKATTSGEKATIEIVALMFQASPTLEPGEAGENLRRTATQDNLATPDEVWGSGRLNATRGVSLLGLALPEAGGQPEVKAGTNPASERVLFTYALPPGTKRARLIVYNVVGQAVFTAELDLQGERFTWELVNDAGEPLANGLYIYVVVADGRRSSLHRLVIRR